MPDAIIYIAAEPEVLMRRIEKRGRKEEKNISLKYLQSVDHYYNQMLSKSMCPVLRLQATDLQYDDVLLAKILNFADCCPLRSSLEKIAE